MKDVQTTTQEQVSVQVDNANVSTFNNAIKSLLAKGATRINNLKIKNINTTDMDNYCRVSFTLTSPVKGFVSNDNGLTYEEGKTNIIFLSLYGIAGAVKEDENLAWLGNQIIENPKRLEVIFSGATVDIIQEFIPANEEFVNPFSSNPTPSIYDHDIIVNHVVKFKLSNNGKDMAKMLAINLMGL